MYQGFPGFFYGFRASNFPVQILYSFYTLPSL
ncbi:hypothetical protein FHX58_000482 [Paraburkholderia tropica]|nr:hypothetical protein [Paraburkholderia tropica]